MQAVDVLHVAVVVAVGGTLVAVPVKADWGYEHQSHHGYSNQHEWWGREHRDRWGRGAFFAPPPVYSPPPVYYSVPPQITPIAPPPAIYGPPAYYSAPPQITPLTPPPIFYGPSVSSFPTAP